MDLLTIGAFARAAQLSPKALRLYDDLGLLRPAAVDADSGYRLYDPTQLDRARLIAWLRRLGMPLADIQQVCDLPGPAAAERVAAYWTQVLTDTQTRSRLATFLVDHLSGRDDAANTTLRIRYAARSESGLVRAGNDDTAYAGSRLLAVADGFGAGGLAASTAAVDALTPLDTLAIPADDLLAALADAVSRADEAVSGIAAGAESGQPGTTLTALLWSGSRLALVHIGDTRAYLLRGGDLHQISHDHTYVQSLVDEGRLTPDEAASHPQRALLVRALTGSGATQPDLSLHTAAVGDRYLLCSDGLSAVVAADTVRTTLNRAAGPQETLDALIAAAYAAAYAAGAPDNVACVVADVVTGP